MRIEHRACVVVILADAKRESDESIMAGEDGLKNVIKFTKYFLM